MDEFIKTSEKLSEVAGKSDADAPDHQGCLQGGHEVVRDCHKDFRVDEGSF